jgi:hypothetical protein
LLATTNHPPDAPVEVVSVDEFFAHATQEEDWHDEEERETVQRFQNLVSVLKQNYRSCRFSGWATSTSMLTLSE